MSYTPFREISVDARTKEKIEDGGEKRQRLMVCVSLQRSLAQGDTGKEEKKREEKSIWSLGGLDNWERHSCEKLSRVGVFEPCTGGYREARVLETRGGRVRENGISATSWVMGEHQLTWRETILSKLTLLHCAIRLGGNSVVGKGERWETDSRTETEGMREEGTSKALPTKQNNQGGGWLNSRNNEAQQYLNTLESGVTNKERTHRRGDKVTVDRKKRGRERHGRHLNPRGFRNSSADQTGKERGN